MPFVHQHKYHLLFQNGVLILTPYILYQFFTIELKHYVEWCSKDVSCSCVLKRDSSVAIPDDDSVENLDDDGVEIDEDNIEQVAESNIDKNSRKLVAETAQLIDEKDDDDAEDNNGEPVDKTG